jgi:hypothetical protein
MALQLIFTLSPQFRDPIHNRQTIARPGPAHKAAHSTTDRTNIRTHDPSVSTETFHALDRAAAVTGKRYL